MSISLSELAEALDLPLDRSELEAHIGYALSLLRRIAALPDEPEPTLEPGVRVVHIYDYWGEICSNIAYVKEGEDLKRAVEDAKINRMLDFTPPDDLLTDVWVGKLAYQLLTMDEKAKLAEVKRWDGLEHELPRDKLVALANEFCSQRKETVDHHFIPHWSRLMAKEE
jgi:hypothetical protein